MRNNAKNWENDMNFSLTVQCHAMVHELMVLSLDIALI